MRLQTKMPNVGGMRLIENWLPDKEADALLNLIDQQPWDTSLKRRVQHYGFKYDYRNPKVEPIGLLPLWVACYAQQLYLDGIFTDKVPNQVIVNEYEPGQGIASHTDCVPCFGDTIASLSLGSQCLMDISDRYEGGSGCGTLNLHLKPNSLLVLKGDSRYKCTHGIIARRSDIINGIRIGRKRRVSVTFRRVIDSHLTF